MTWWSFHKKAKLLLHFAQICCVWIVLSLNGNKKVKLLDYFLNYFISYHFLFYQTSLTQHPLTLHCSAMQVTLVRIFIINFKRFVMLLILRVAYLFNVHVIWNSECIWIVNAFKGLRQCLFFFIDRYIYKDCIFVISDLFMQILNVSVVSEQKPKCSVLFAHYC